MITPHLIEQLGANEPLRVSHQEVEQPEFRRARADRDCQRRPADVLPDRGADPQLYRIFSGLGARRRRTALIRATSSRGKGLDDVVVCQIQA